MGKVVMEVTLYLALLHHLVVGVVARVMPELITGAVVAPVVAKVAAVQPVALAHLGKVLLVELLTSVEVVAVALDRLGSQLLVMTAE